MSDSIVALLPVFLLIALGHAMRRARFLPDAFWAPAEKLTYFVTFPALLVANLAAADFSDLPALPVAGVLAAATLVNAALVLVPGRGLAKSGPAFTSIFQGVIRPNTYVGLAAAASLFGEAGVTLTAVCIAAVVPLVNVLSVVAMVHWAGRPSPGVAGFVLPVATNPLIIACAVGIGLNAGGVGLPPVVGPTLEALGRAALPVGLLAVGAGLDFGALFDGRRVVLFTGAMKLVLLPMLAAAGASLAGLSGLATAVAVLYASLPCSPSAYVLSRQMGGDSGLLAGIITTQTLLAAIILPLNLLIYAR